MGLKAIVQDINEVPEGLRDFYIKVGDEYVLETDDGKFKDRIGEFRSNNISLRQKLEQMEEQVNSFKGLDPSKIEEMKEAQRKLAELEEKHMIDAGQIDEVVAQRTERMRAELSGQVESLTSNLNSLKSERDTYRNKLNSTLIQSTIAQAVTDVGVPRKGAMRDIVARAQDLWQVDDNGNLVPMREGKVVYGGDTSNPLTPGEWAKDILREAPYLFEPNSGGGASGSNQNQTAAGTVDWADANSIGDNLEDIASGKVQVVGGAAGNG